MPEELEPGSLSDFEIGRTGTLDALDRGEDLKGRDVVDLEGHRIGRVTKCFVKNGELSFCEIRLDKSLKGAMDVEKDVVPVPAHWIRGLDGDRVALMRHAAEVTRPEDALDSTSGREGGSAGKPRKTR